MALSMRPKASCHSFALQSPCQILHHPTVSVTTMWYRQPVGSPASSSPMSFSCSIRGLAALVFLVPQAGQPDSRGAADCRLSHSGSSVRPKLKKDGFCGDFLGALALSLAGDPPMARGNRAPNANPNAAIISYESYLLPWEDPAIIPSGLA